MSKTICYYHKVDLDGKCSAAIVRRKYPDCELIGVDYPDRPDFEKITKSDRIIIVDFSFSAEDMYDLLCICNERLIWIDHHKSAIDKVAEFTLPDNHAPLIAAIEGARKIDKAGCELTWEYFFPDESMPLAVWLLGRYDVWHHEHLAVLPFQYGMRVYEWNPMDILWSALFDNCPDNFAEILGRGPSIQKYQALQDKEYVDRQVFPVEFKGHKAWAINKGLGNSKIFETVPDAAERPLWILFSYKAGMWRYSLYAAPGSGLDVSKIAVKYGGGGHAGAASFQSDKYVLIDK